MKTVTNRKNYIVTKTLMRTFKKVMNAEFLGETEADVVKQLKEFGMSNGSRRDDACEMLLSEEETLVIEEAK